MILKYASISLWPQPWTCFFRYLSDLHTPGDPAWQCIGAQHKWILQLMHSCKEGYVKDLKGKYFSSSVLCDSFMSFKYVLGMF